MSYIPDNYDAYRAYEARLDAEERRLPICAKCGERIMSEKAYEIDGYWCEDCANEWLNDIAVWTDELED